MDPLLARTLDNKYLIEKLLGKGGMGSVYLALHTGTKRNVAVKVISPQYMRNKELLIRFQREAEASGRLSHPNVVNVTDFGVTVIDTTAIAYLVMEYLDGESLHEHLQKNPSLSPILVVDILEQIALGVTEAHSRGILHRDLKPQNIWLQPDGRGGFIVKVLDFGIAKLADPSALAFEVPDLEAAPNADPTPLAAQDDNSTVLIAPTEMGLTSAFAESTGFATTFGATLGTPAFMSPEQCAGRPVSEKSDLYSLAMMSYLMLAGELPFKGSAKQLIEQQIATEPPPPHHFNPRLSEIVSQAILQSLAKDPDRRAPSCHAFVARLRAAVEGEVHLLKESRSAGIGQSGAWFGLLLAAVLPASLTLNAARALLRPAIEAKSIRDLAAFAILMTLHVLVAYIALAWADTAMARWTIYLRSHEPSFRGWLAVVWAGYRAAPRCLSAALLTFQPLRHAIAHIVGAVEGTAASTAQARSAHLLSGAEHVAVALLVRRVAVTLLVAAYYPAVMMILRVPIPILFREYFSPSLGGVLGLVSFSFAPIYGSFLAAWLLLYERCRRAWGEAPVGSERRYVPFRGKVGERLRMGTKFWSLVPVLLFLVLFLPPFLGWNDSLTDNISTAALQGRHQDVLAMLDRGDDPNESKGRGRLPLVVAVQNGDMQMAEILMKRGARVDGRDNLAGPLHYAVMTHRHDMLDWLLDHGAKVEMADNSGDTPLSLAAKNGETAMVKKLLAKGADPLHKNEDGQTPLDHARRLGRTDIVQLLEGKK